MSDRYPEILNIEIDRDRLRNYLRAKWLLSWAFPLAFFGAFIGLPVMAHTLEQGTITGGRVVFVLVRSFGTSIGISLLLALVCYLIFSHRSASRLAASLQVTVEGSFLRLRQQTGVLSDRKLHFRSIVDFTATQDSLMRRFGIHTLQMSTTAGGQHNNLMIPGVKDCLRIRDILAEIDSQRENR